ncbi:MAG: DUF1559 domain-containing protein [Pirellulaceae bacterium]|nr:DUF1559 domain-containing protein [Pirellulaceae bacterium]
MAQLFAGRGISAHRRPGFTLVELLVVIAIIGVLVAILLPAVQAAREASRRSSCGNKLRQLMIAAHNYHDSQRQLPTGAINTRPNTVWDEPTKQCDGHAANWLVLILPQLERNELYDDYTKQYRANPNCALDECNDVDAYARLWLPIAACPSNPVNKTDDIVIDDMESLARGNYAACFGAGNLNQSWSNINMFGAFSINARVNFSDVTDGTSSTLALSEVKSSIANTDSRGIWAMYSMGSSTFSVGRGPNSPVGDLTPACNDTKVGPCAASVTLLGTQIAAARSYHPGGVMVAHVDASVRFVANSINPTLWTALGTRAGTEVVTNY